MSGTASPGRVERRRRRVIAAAAVAVAVVVVLLLLRSCGAEPAVVRAVAAGDMVCDVKDPAYGDGRGTGDACRAADVSDLAVSLEPDVMLGLGDYVYEVPTTEGYDRDYDATWGRLREVTIPAIGNQEYKVHEANTYRAYFGERAQPVHAEGRTYWSTDIGAWHVVVLDSNCTVVAGGCLTGSPQQEWLAEDLAEDDAMCTLALWHHPRWSTGIAGADDRTADLFRTLQDHGVEMVLSGHEAHYERFAPHDAAGQPDPSGVVQYVVGTGGQAHYDPSAGNAGWRTREQPVTSEFADYSQHGVLLLTLEADAWSWEFHSPDGKEALDAGSGRCR